MRLNYWQSAIVVTAACVFTSSAIAADPSNDSPEQKVLDKWLGEWRNTYKVLRSEMTPEEKSLTSDVTAKRVLGGRYVQETSKSSDGSEGLFMLTYDPDQKKYRGWWFSSDTPSGEYAGTWDEDSQTLTMTALRFEPATLVLTHQFEDDGHTKWKFAAKDVAGKVWVHMEGSTERVKKPNGN